MPATERWALAERLAGNVKAHVFYAAPAARETTVAKPTTPQAIPVLHRLDPAALAATIAKRGRLRFSADGLTVERGVDRSLAPIAALIDGRRDLGAIQSGLRGAIGSDWMRFAAAFAKLYAPLDGFNALRLSGFRR